MDKLDTLIACLPAAPFRNQLTTEIESLREQLAALKTDQKPVAWLDEKRDMTYRFGPQSPTDIPLYTHPARTLSDEEIIEITQKVASTSDRPIGMIAFGVLVARAVLKEASK